MFFLYRNRAVDAIPLNFSTGAEWSFKREMLAMLREIEAVIVPQLKFIC
jgi:hypothetical protein